MRSELRWTLGVLALAIVALTVRYVTADAAEGAPRSLAAWPSTGDLEALALYLMPPPPGQTFVVPETRLTEDAFFDDFDDAPFEPAPVQQPAVASAPQSWRVSAVLIAENRRVAIVNDSVVGVGDPLPGGTRVLSIDPDSVVLRTSGGSRTVLRL